MTEDVVDNRPRWLRALTAGGVGAASIWFAAEVSTTLSRALVGQHVSLLPTEDGLGMVGPLVMMVLVVIATGVTVAAYAPEEGKR